MSNSRIARSSTVTLAVLASFGLSSAVAAPKAKAPAGKETKVVFDPQHSNLKWEGKKSVIDSKHEGLIKLKSGELSMAGDQLKGGKFEIDMTSLTNTDVTDAEKNAQLVGHLKSEDFFDVAKFPTATVKIKNAKSVEGIVGPTYEVVADLTIKGKTNEVKFPATIIERDGKKVAKANITIDRTKWDVRYGSGKFFKGLGDKAIADNFQVDLELVSGT